jgi:predicted nucleic acid-binding protein
VPVRRCIELIERRVGAYDSVYAAIAIERAIPLVTSDARLARALGEPDWVILVP